MPQIQVLLASTRTTRFGDRPAAWVMDRLAHRGDLDVELVDLRDHPLPFFDDAIPPVVAGRDYACASTAEWGQRIDVADGYVVVTPEYNQGYPAALKNALDHLSVELRRKPIAYVGYGGLGAARAIAQLRQIAGEQEMVPVRHAVHVLPDLVGPALLADPFDVELLAPLDPKLERLADDLVWWATTLSGARAAA